MHAQDRRILIRAHEKARGDHHPVVHGLRIDMLDLADALDDLFQRLGDQLNGVGRAQAVRLHQHIHHRHADLRFLFARQHGQRERAEQDRGEQDHGRQRRVDEQPRKMTGKSKRSAASGIVTIFGIRHGWLMTSPGRRPERISRPASVSRPGCTTTSLPSSRRT